MPVMRKAATVIASGALAATAGLAGAPAAFADGPDTPPEVKAEIEALQWPEYASGDSDPDIRVAQYLFRHLNLYPGDTVSDTFDAPTETAVVDFQNQQDLYDSGTLNQETWNTLRSEIFGEYGQGTSGDPVRAIQYSLATSYDKDIAVDGQYGPNTEQAVVEVQREFGIDEDGIVGPITFRALVAGGV